MEDFKLLFNMKEEFFTDEEGRTRRRLFFTMPKEGEGKTVREFLSEYLHFSNKQISSLKFRIDGIQVNGRCRRVYYVLQKGDLLSIVPKSAGSLYLEHGSFSSPPDIIYEDGDLLIVNKPSGIVCHPSPGHYCDTLANQAAYYSSLKNENWTIRLIGRLDKDTSGICVFAKNSESASLLSRSTHPDKTYYAVVKGSAPSSGVIDLPIKHHPEVLGQMITAPDGKPCRTYFENIGEYPGDNSILKVRIEQGRTHQIRLHLASLGFPLVGDSMYGSGIKDKTHAMLHCECISFEHPFSHKCITLHAPFPSDWEVLPKALEPNSL